MWDLPSSGIEKGRLHGLSGWSLVAISLIGQLLVLLIASGSVEADEGRPGRVIYDRNGNGVLEPDEPGLAGWWVCVMASLDHGSCAHTRADGSFDLTFYGPGRPTILTPPSHAPPPKSDPVATTLTFDLAPDDTRTWVLTYPQQNSYYVLGFTPTEEDIAGSSTFDFGVHPAQAAVFRGSIWVDGAPAPPGTSVQARVNNIVCGKGSAGDFWGRGWTAFALAVFDSDDRTGCAEEGAIITFHIKGRLANETAIWQPSSFRNGREIMLTVGTPLAGYYGTIESLDEEQLPAGPVMAYIGNTLCGEVRRWEFTSDFGRAMGPLVVPAARGKPGDGVRGAVVRFTVAGLPVQETVNWQPGLHELTLTVRQDVPRAPLPGFPMTGRAGYVVTSGGLGAVSNALVILAVAAVGVIVLFYARQHRP